MNRTSLAFTVILAIVGALVLRSFFPRTETETKLIVHRTPPVRDTASIDSLQRTITSLQAKIKRTKPDTLYLERVTSAPPDTVYRVPELVGLYGLLVGKNVGDTTLGFGYRVHPLDTGYTINPWTAVWLTPGPVSSFSFDHDGTPMLGFYDPPKPRKDCNLFCKLGHYAVGGVGGYAICKLGG